MCQAYLQKEALAQVFSCELCKSSKNTFFTEHLRATASVNLFVPSEFIVVSLLLHMKKFHSLFRHI